MGCCISKFNPEMKKFKEEEEYSYVEDKLVVSHYQTKVSPFPMNPEKKQFIPIPDKVIHIHIPDKLLPLLPPPKLSPLSPTPTSTTSNTSVSSSSSSLSTASSVSASKDRSFSNEFLQARSWDNNPHVVRISSLREASLSLKTPKPATPTRCNSPARAKRYPSSPSRSNPNPRLGSRDSPTQKRIRASSPNHRPLTRQNSFREDQESAVSVKSGRFLKSPSPSRRFGTAGSRVTGLVSAARRRESSEPSGSTANLRNRAETRIHRIGSKIDENVVKEVITSQNEPVVPPEDMNNPLISLDCFIFL